MKFFSFLDHKVIKTAAAAVISIAIAQYIGLEFALTAGVIAIISLQGTRKETFTVAIERIVATGIGLLLADALFDLLGHTYLVLGLYILIFMPICVRFNIIQGFLVNVVLTTHILTAGVSTKGLLINEFSLVLVGLGTALIFNIYMPDLNKELGRVSREIDITLQKILVDMSETFKCSCVSTEQKKFFDELKELGSRARVLTVTEFKNSIFVKNTGTMEYFNMRYIQYKILKRMKLLLSRIDYTSPYTEDIPSLLVDTAHCRFIREDISTLLKKIATAKNIVHREKLPETTEEFRSSAIIYQFISDLEEYVNVADEYLLKNPESKKLSST